MYKQGLYKHHCGHCNRRVDQHVYNMTAGTSVTSIEYDHLIEVILIKLFSSLKNVFNQITQILLSHSNSAIHYTMLPQRCTTLIDMNTFLKPVSCSVLYLLVLTCLLFLLDSTWNLSCNQLFVNIYRTLSCCITLGWLLTVKP